MDTIVMGLNIGLPDVLIPLIACILGICLALIVIQMISKAKSKTFEQDLQRQIEGAKREAENIIKSAKIDAAAETIKKKEQFSAESNKMRSKLHETEMRLSKRDDILDRQAAIGECIERRVGVQADLAEVRYFAEVRCFGAADNRNRIPFHGVALLFRRLELGQ